jgi:ribosomal protein S18 acetylase RimI-like enzyme
MSMEIRPLTENDAAPFWVIRLEGLQDSPEAFGEAYEDALATPLAEIERRLRQDNNTPHNFILGAFVAGKLVGVVGFRRYIVIKAKHRAVIWGMYTTPSQRGKGIGRGLMEELIARAKALLGLDSITLSVVATNPAARQLYLNLGFKTYGVEPCGLKVGDQFLDLELMILEF